MAVLDEKLMEPDIPSADEVASWLVELESGRADVERFLTP